MKCLIQLNLFSPRWGHDDTYTIELTMSEMKINVNSRTSICKYVENLDPKWDGEDLYNILINDKINPPLDFKKLLEHAWISWRMEELDNENVNSELQLLANWVNSITKSKPDSEFWNEYF